MKVLLFCLALFGTGMVMAPAVGRAVHTRAQRVESAATQSVSQAEDRIGRWGDRLLEAIVRSGERIADELPTQTPAPWNPPAAPGPEPSLSPPAPPAYSWPCPYPVTIFRQQTWRRSWGRMGRL